MLTVTEAACEHLAELLKAHDAPEGTAIRFVNEGQGIALQHDSEREGDTTFEHDGRTVLLLGTQMAELLAEAKLDIEDAKLCLLQPGGSE